MNTNPDFTMPSNQIPSDANLADLLAAWRTHEDNRANGASLAELIATRSQLDATREVVQSSLALAS